MSSSLSLPRSNAKTSWSWTIFRHTKFRAPRRAGDVAQPCGGEVERGLTVRERAHDTRAPPDLAQDALERVVAANPPPVLLREGVVGKNSAALSASPMQASEWDRRQSDHCHPHRDNFVFLGFSSFFCDAPQPHLLASVASQVL